ncbi:unnamed protein product [Miscanthus lutarioriparius]|uniref:Terpene synthase N-terminal domain-containing protein n=1 Tax=Miscanthus lutarioriparius TaxID=422564 RepID=A0A811Q2B6_9POAL|nr:unnamed protein product [Miscanthus lutarioriparius]
MFGIFLKDEQSGMPEMIDAIGTALRSMGDGEISISAYDTAWVALVKSLNGDNTPQFPSCIDWIARNQLLDGSWGLSFISENMWRLTKDDDNWTLCGFEIIFPMLLEKAKNLGVNIPLDDPTLEAIYAKRELKFTKIPRDALHVVPTTFLLSIEGMPGLDWKRQCKLQCPDGSFMSSPAPTAYALMQTGDPKCFEFLDRVVSKFNGSVPFVYPIEMFERLWAVDRLERLGISRYFKSEIKDYLDYIYRNWTEEGLAFTKGCLVKDIDGPWVSAFCDCMATMSLLFENDDGQFVCYARQSNQSVTAMYNLFRAANQTTFPDDDHILRRAKSYTRGFLRERRATGQLNDKWIISEGLPGEVGYGLDFPWEASMPRIETRMYLEQYGGSADVGIGKVLYRTNLFSNDMYLKVAKADLRKFQRLCRLEWHSLKRWCGKNNLEMYGVTRQSALRAYFLAAASNFEPSRAAERLAWARTAVLAEAISGCLLMSSNTHDDRTMTAEWLVGEFVNSDDDNPASGRGKKNSRVTSSLGYALRDLIDIHASGNASVADCLRGANGENMDKIDDLDRMVGFEMQELAQCVFQSCSSINRETRQTFLHVTKSYYYVALCSHETIEHHISKDSVVPTEIIRGLLRLVFVYVGKDAQNFLLNKYQRNRCHVREKVEESLHLMLNAQRNKNCMSSDPELLFPSSLKHNHVRRLRLCLHTSHPMATPIQVSILAALQELWKQVCWAGQWHHSLVVMIGEAFE